MKYIFTLIAFSAAMFAQQITMKYDLEVTLLGKVGTALITHYEADGRYKITAEARASGTAASLSKHYRETYTSEGRVVDGRYIPEIFTKRKHTDTETGFEVYRFDHDAQSVTRERTREKMRKRTRFDVSTMRLVSTEEIKHEDDFKVLKRYAEDDPLSSFLNARAVAKGQVKRYRVDAIAIKPENVALISPLLERSVQLTVEGIEGTSKVAVDIELDEDYMIKRATAEDILLFGDVSVQRLYRHTGAL